MTTTTLDTSAISVTEKEQHYLTKIASSEYGDYLGDHVWTNCIWHDLGKGAAGVASSLVKKGLIHSDGSFDKEACTHLTDLGVALCVARQWGSLKPRPE